MASFGGCPWQGKKKTKGGDTMATKAFLVGINDYAPVGSGGPDLRGCISDVRDMANTLVVCGFAPAGIRICTNSQATKAGILKGLDWLIRGSKKGDSLLFYYSGHGSQVVDTSGDEVDRNDEIICPHDLNFATKAYISDDDLRLIFSKLSEGVNLEVILDSCHSGTGTREALALEDLPEENCVGTRYLEPPIDFTFHLEYESDLKTKKLLKAKVGERAAVIARGLNHILWAACRDNQTSQETNIGGAIRGVFTYHFCQVLRKAYGKLSRKQIDSIVTAAIRRAGFVQIPQLESSAPEMMHQPFK